MSFEEYGNAQGAWGEALQNDPGHHEAEDPSNPLDQSNNEIQRNSENSSYFHQNAVGQTEQSYNSFISDHNNMLTVPQVILSPFDEEENFLSPQKGLDRPFQAPTINIEKPSEQLNNDRWELSLQVGSHLPASDSQENKDIDHDYLSTVENSGLENQYSLSVGDKSVSLRDLSRLSDHSSSPAMHKQELAVSPQVCYLTMANDDLDDILSLHSATTENSEFVHINTMDELNAILQDSYETGKSSINEQFESLSPYDAFSSVSASLKTPNPPHINIQADTEDAKLSVAPSPRTSFNDGEKRPNINYLAVNNNDDFVALTDDDDLDDVHEQMRLGRKQLRRPSRKSVGSRSIDRSLSLDEKARSLSRNRDKLLELAALQVPESSTANPSSPISTNEQPPASSENSTGAIPSATLDEGESALNLSGNTRRKSLQKNPAIYSCDLCDKKFTRPYNLKSHLRTHTDERPFSCSVCGKAFARQHDRKRHEDLHSGKKRYVCGGNLKDGTAWGCGKKFARSDALGRHFKTDSGRRCIAPLYEEASRERAAHNLAPPSENEQFWLV